MGSVPPLLIVLAMIAVGWVHRHQLIVIEFLIPELIVRMAQDDRSWGYTRIQGALADLNHQSRRGTIANVLKRYGIAPAPERGRRTPWFDVSQCALEGGVCK